MSIFDVFGGTSKFKKGMEIGAKPFAEKFEQHAEALKRLENSFGKQWKENKEVANECLNKVDAIERARLYDLYPQYDIKELEPEYKDFLVAVLYTLNSGNSNELQQSYIRSVQKYLDIKNPQAKIDISKMENIESLNAQKALFQVCVEYLLLGNNNPSFFEQYDESLFTYFSLKEKPMLEIWENVLQIYSAIGPLGLAEKYGFVPQVKNKEKVISGEERLLEQYFIDDIIEIPANQELIIENKEIFLKDDIICFGKLIFNNCILRYNGANIRKHIHLKTANAELALFQCTIIDNNEKTIVENLDKDFPNNSLIVGGIYSEKVLTPITVGSHDVMKDNYPKLKVEKCLFLNCLFFADEVISIYIDSAIQYTKISCTPVELALKSEYNEQKYAIKKSQKQSYCVFINRGISEFKGCIIDFSKDESSNKESPTNWFRVRPFFSDVKGVINCTIFNLKNPIDLYRSEKTIPEVTRCHFDNCSGLFMIESGPLVISDCVFVDCSDVYDNDDSSIKILNCTGLDNTESSKAKDAVPKLKTANGEPIGASIKENEVGVPIY